MPVFKIKNVGTLQPSTSRDPDSTAICPNNNLIMALPFRIAGVKYYYKALINLI